MKPQALIVLALVASLAAACGDAKSPTTPSPAAPSASRALSLATLATSHLTISISRVGDAFVGTPSIVVTESGGKSGATLTNAVFEINGAHVGGEFSRTIVLTAGGEKTVVGGELVFEPTNTSPATVMLNAVISFADDAGTLGTATASAPIPVPQGRATAELAISRFTVAGSVRPGPTFVYIPTFQIVETSGLSGASITHVSIQLLDTRERPTTMWLGAPRAVPAGGTLELGQPDVYGDYEFAIWGPDQTSRLQVVVSFTDDAGHLGSVTAIALVSWGQS